MGVSSRYQSVSILVDSFRSNSRANQEKFRSHSGAVPKQNRSKFRVISQRFKDSFGTIPEQIQSNFGTVSGVFWRISGIISVLFQCKIRAMPIEIWTNRVQNPTKSRTNLEKLRKSRAIPERFQSDPRVIPVQNQSNFSNQADQNPVRNRNNFIKTTKQIQIRSRAVPGPFQGRSRAVPEQFWSHSTNKPDQNPVRNRNNVTETTQQIAKAVWKSVPEQFRISSGSVPEQSARTDNVQEDGGRSGRVITGHWSARNSV